MSDEQINEAISKILNADEHWMIQKDYCNDLNAIHEAEKTLNSEQWHLYSAWLFKATARPQHATARQRAEAFLRTLGKWEGPTTEESSADHLRDATKMMEVQK
jgi:hypothetical protein